MIEMGGGGREKKLHPSSSPEESSGKKKLLSYFNIEPNYRCPKNSIRSDIKDGGLSSLPPLDVTPPTNFSGSRTGRPLLHDTVLRIGGTHAACLRDPSAASLRLPVPWTAGWRCCCRCR